MDKIVSSLHPLERKVLPVIARAKRFDDIVRESGLQPIEVMRALQWLENRELLKIETDSYDRVELDENGLAYLTSGLPERRFLISLKEGSLSIGKLKEKARLGDDELNIAMGILKKRGLIEIQKGMEPVIGITELGRKSLEKEIAEEAFLKKGFPLNAKSLSKEDMPVFEELKRRKKILKITPVNDRSATLTEMGARIARLDLNSGNEIDKLTPSLLKSGGWKGREFRGFDVSINVPRISGGRRHFTRQAVDYIKDIWLELGFKEMKGNIVQTSFWDLDCLFVPQDHPAREMQDTFYLKNPARGRILDKALEARIKATHENGWTTGSKGWQSSWSDEKAKENILRTHTTVLSAQAIYRLKKEELPAKFFSVGLVFRNETLDWKHLFEFHQVEGIVVDPDVSFMHLIGYLRDFYRKMGYEHVRIRPAHFPYTEPSAEVEVFHPVRKEWVELGGCGVFRPEVVKPLLGIDVPVLAWGLGLGRIIAEYWKIADIRELNKNDLKQIREMKIWMR